MSKLGRNVPILTSLEMSPFCILVCPLFSCFVPDSYFARKISRQEALGMTIPISFDLRHPCLVRSVGLVRSAALRSPKGGAFRAQRRARPTRAALRLPLTLASPSLAELLLA